MTKLTKEMLNEIENAVEELHTYFREKYNTTETNLKNIEVGDVLNWKTLYLDYPWESHEHVTNSFENPKHFVETTTSGVSENDKMYISNFKLEGSYAQISYFYYLYEASGSLETYFQIYYKPTEEVNQTKNFNRIILPKFFGKVTSIDTTDYFYSKTKIKTDEMKLLAYTKKTWVDNEIPWIQQIDNIEEGINNVAKMVYEPVGYQYKEWLTTGQYSHNFNTDLIIGNAGLGQKPISENDFERWKLNINLLKDAMDVIINIWNVVSYINWNEESQFEWEEN